MTTRKVLEKYIKDSLYPNHKTIEPLNNKKYARTCFTSTRCSEVYWLLAIFIVYHIRKYISQISALGKVVIVIFLVVMTAFFLLNLAFFLSLPMDTLTSSEWLTQLVYFLCKYLRIADGQEENEQVLCIGIGLI